MTDTPLVSVVIATYNTEYPFLKEAIGSILTQTFSDFELILVDDCSTQYCDFSFIADYHDPRIRLVKNEINRGLPYSLNRAISLSRGKYIARMDADDISMPERLARQVQFMEQHPEVDVCGTRCYIFGAYSHIRRCLIPGREFLRASLFFHCMLTHPSVIIRRSFLEQQNIRYDERFRKAQDYELWTRIVDNGAVADEITEPLLCYRVSPKRASDGEVISEQSVLGTEVRNRELSRLYRDADEHELVCHSALCNGRIDDRTSLGEIDAWCAKLLALNKTAELLPQRYFKLAMADLYFSLKSEQLSKCRLLFGGLSLFGVSTSVSVLSRKIVLNTPKTLRAKRISKIVQRRRQSLAE